MNIKTTDRLAARRLTVAMGIPAALLATALATAGSAHAGTVGVPQSATRTFDDGASTWTVPANTHSVTLTVIGASGDNGRSGSGSAGGAAGHGGVVHETLPVSPGQVVTIFPGGSPLWHQDVPGWYETFGGSGGSGDLGNGGGRGGRPTMVYLGSKLVAVAGAGGGGGGGGAVSGYNGGAGGDAQHGGSNGSGYGAGSAGSGQITGSTSNMDGEAGGTAPAFSYAGGGGGGGAGWNGGTLGGGRGGQAGSYGGGGGGGAAGGQSWGMQADATYSVYPGVGDGKVFLDWVPNADTTSTLTGPASVPQGRSITFTDTVVSPSAAAGSPLPTGTVTFQIENIYDYSKQTVGTAKVVNGVATFTMSSFPVGNAYGIHALYNGDDNYEASASTWLYPNVTAPIKTLALSPTTVAFGNVVINTTATRTATLTNTGSIAWSWTSAAATDGTVNMPANTCGTLAPGQSCTLTVSFKPSATGAVSAYLSFASNFGTIYVPVSGTGVNPAPRVTAISPASGPKAGGTRVTITGTSFIGVTSIKIGGVAMAAVSCSSQTTCTATTPVGTAGVRDLQVATPAGTSAVVTADRFTYV